MRCALALLLVSTGCLFPSYDSPSDKDAAGGTADASVPVPDAAQPADAAIPPPDAMVDAAIPPPDAMVDAAIPPPDAMVDAAIPPPDAMVDAAIPPPDAMVDAAIPPPDAMVDAAIPPPDAAIPPPDAMPLGSGVQTLAGQDTPGADDGFREVATFNNPVNVAVGPDGHIYVADFSNDRIREITPAGLVTTLTSQALFQRPFGIAFGPDGTLYVQTDDNPTGAHSTETGTIWVVDSLTGEAVPVVSDIGRPRGITVLLDGTIAMVDHMHHVVRLLDPDTGVVTELAGLYDTPGYEEGAGDTARFEQPWDVVVNASGDLLVTDVLNHRIRKVTQDGDVTTYAGAGAEGGDDGPAATATFKQPRALAIDGDDRLYLTDSGGYTLRMVSADGVVSTIAGDGTAGVVDGEPLQAEFYGLEGLAIDSAGAILYISDGNRGDGSQHHRVRRMTLY